MVGKIAEKLEDLFRKVKIFPRIFGIMLLLSLVPIIFITYFNFYQYIAAMQKDMESYLSLLVGNVSVQIDNRFTQYEKLACSFYANRSNLELLQQNAEIAAQDVNYESNEIYEKNKKVIGERLYSLSSGDSNIANLEFVTEYDQYTMTDYTGQPHGGMIKDRNAFIDSEYWNTALDAKGYACWFDTTSNRTLVYKALYSTSGIGNTFTMAIAVYSMTDRQFIGVLLCNADAEFLKNCLTSYAFYGTGNTFLLTKTSILAVLNPNINAPNFEWKDGLLQNVLGKEEGDFIQKIHGRNVFVSFKKNPQLDLYVAHVVDMGTLLQPAFETRNRCLLLAALILLSCMILAHCSAMTISAPLNRLVKSMEDFGRKELNVRCKVDGKDELSVVGAQFNEMAENTEKLVGEMLESRLREKTLELSKANAELNALQMQINPHFLYNTLDLIRWDTIRIGKGENNASRMIDSFCCLMRMSVKKNENFVPVNIELEHADAYVDVVNFRHTQKIVLTKDLSFDTSFYSIPKLTLQPLIENAVVHGFGKHIQDAEISITGWKKENDIIIAIADNGKGMEQEELEKLRKSFEGNAIMQNSIGLHNVNQRFKLCFGECYGVEVESEPQMGATVTIRFPQSSVVSEKEEMRNV